MKYNIFDTQTMDSHRTYSCQLITKNLMKGLIVRLKRLSISKFNL